MNAAASLNCPITDKPCMRGCQDTADQFCRDWMERPDLPGGTIRTHTRADELTDIRAKLRSMAHDCIDDDNVEAAQSLLGAEQMLLQAFTQLEENDSGDVPLERPRERAAPPTKE